METVRLTAKYQVTLPRATRERLQLRPGMRIIVLEKGGVISLVPERQLQLYRGIAEGVNPEELREKRDRY